MISNEEAILSIDTLMHYGLKQQPFAAEAPDAYIYSDPALDMPVNAALNFLQTEDHIVVLKGEYGIGKTTHVKKLISKSRGTLTPCLFSANISSSLAEIEHSMRQCWPVDMPQLSLVEFLTSAQQKGIRPALIIDDAHDLDINVLEQLFLIRREVKERCGSGFGLLLVGENTIEHTLSSLEADVPEISHSHSLVVRPLTREQVHAYIDHRIRVAGMFTASPYNAEAIEDIVRTTHGLPGDINTAATRMLEHFGQAVLNQEKANRPGWLHHNRVPLIIIVVASIALAGIFFLIHGIFISDSPERESGRRVISAPPPLTSKEASDEQESAEEVPKSADDKTQTEIQDPAVKPIPETEPSIEIPPAEKTIQPESQTPAVEETGAAEAPSPLTEPEIEQVETPKPEPQSTSGENIAPKEASSEKDSPVAPPSIKDSSWILEQKPEFFAVQLLALSSLDALEKAANELRIDTDLAYYTRKKDGKTLYILIAASYPDRATAEKAVGNYPASLRRGKPWIRPLKDVQDTIYAQ